MASLFLQLDDECTVEHMIVINSNDSLPHTDPFADQSKGDTLLKTDRGLLYSDALMETKFKGWSTTD